LLGGRGDGKPNPFGGESGMITPGGGVDSQNDRRKPKGTRRKNFIKKSKTPERDPGGGGAPPKWITKASPKRKVT